MKFWLFNLFVLSITSAELMEDPKPCTDSVRELVDGIMDIASSSEKNKWVPDEKALKEVLVSINDIMLKCAGKTSDIPKYYPCLHRIYPILTDIQSITYEIMDKDYDQAAEDIIALIVHSFNGISYCIDIN